MTRTALDGLPLHISRLMTLLVNAAVEAGASEREADFTACVKARRELTEAIRRALARTDAPPTQEQ